MAEEIKGYHNIKYCRNILQSCTSDLQVVEQNDILCKICILIFVLITTYQRLVYT